MIDKLFDFLGYKKKSAESTVIGVSTSTYPDQGKPEIVSSKSLVERYRSWAFICASRNAAMIADVPLRLYGTRATGEQQPRVASKKLDYREKSKLFSANKSIANNVRFKTAEEIYEIYEHPFINLINTMNPNRGKFETFEETSLFLDVTGNCYWLMDLNNAGIPQSIYILPSQFVRIEPGEDKMVKSYIYGNGLKKQTIPQELVCHFKTPNVRDMYYGMGCLEAALQSSDLMDSYNVEEQALNRNKGIPPVIFQYKTGDLTEAQIRTTEAELSRLVSGIANRGKNKILSGDWDIKQLAFSPSEMQYLEGRKWCREEIANAFGVPLALVSVENVNRAVSREANYQYQKFTIKPRLSRISDRINEKIIPYYNEPRLYVAFDDPVPADEELDVKNAVALVGAGIITVEEARETLGYDTLETYETGE